MKKIKSIYSDKIVDSKFYGTININNTSPDKMLTEEEFKDGKPGFIYVPYIYGEATEKSSKEYDIFMKEYHKQHQCCPNCGDKRHSTTLMGYILNMDKKEDYKDLNRCTCTKCGNQHSTHSRVPSKNI